MTQNACKHLFISVTAALLLAQLITGCGTLNVLGPDKDQALEQRVKAYIAANNSQDIQKLYDFCTPEYKKEISVLQFARSMPNTPVEMHLKQIDHAPGSDTASAVLLYNFDMMGFTVKDMEIPQKWVFADGDWYIQAEPPGSPESLFMSPPKKNKKKSGK